MATQAHFSRDTLTTDTRELVTLSHTELCDMIVKVAERMKLDKDKAEVRVHQARLVVACGDDGMFITITVFDRDDMSMFGLGASKRHYNDKPNIARGVNLALSRAVRSLVTNMDDRWQSDATPPESSIIDGEDTGVHERFFQVPEE
jgi:hypothetical protein